MHVFGFISFCIFSFIHYILLLNIISFPVFFWFVFLNILTYLYDHLLVSDILSRGGHFLPVYSLFVYFFSSLAFSNTLHLSMWILFLASDVYPDPQGSAFWETSCKDQDRGGKTPKICHKIF